MLRPDCGCGERSGGWGLLAEVFPKRCKHLKWLARFVANGTRVPHELSGIAFEFDARQGEGFLNGRINALPERIKTGGDMNAMCVCFFANRLKNAGRFACSQDHFAP